MIKFEILFLALTLSPCLSLRFRGSNRQMLKFVKPGDSGPLKTSDYAMSEESIGNHNVRRVQPLIQLNPEGLNKNSNSELYDKLKSLELDGSLADFLDIDARDQNAVKKNVGFKVVNMNDFDTDRQKSKQSNLKKVKLVQSLEPPENYFKKYAPNRILNSDRDSVGQNINRNSKKIYKQNKKPKWKSVFNNNGMMYLTQPKDNEGRKLTDLVNKIMQVKADYERGGLRQPKSRFTPNELKQMRVIAQAMKEEDRLQDDDNELDQLLQQEQLLLNKDGPVEIVVAELSPDTNEVKLLPNKLQIKDILNLQSGADNKNDDIIRVLTQLITEQSFDDDDEDKAYGKVKVIKLPVNIGNGLTRNYEKETRLKKNLRDIPPHVSLLDNQPKGTPTGTAEHQFNFEDLVS
ncbi:hypothetical protein O0L34_g14448 [Tuta absoluta]|nr:hypothetical protein O0L34_g14448 [Tuta absoluta]